jgi:FAD/FMN-containing dehydrogenase
VTTSHITNFGGNIRFKPRRFYIPTSEDEILRILDNHSNGKIRVGGALHSWNGGILSNEVFVDLRHFNAVNVEYGKAGEVWATAGGGCRIKHLLRKLHACVRSTLPSLGLITEQTIAGAISTATHGSGKHSLSHYAEEVRVAAYDIETGKARIYTINEGRELLAARCAIGCMGIVLSVRLRCIPAYNITEVMVPCRTLDDALSSEGDYPLQQFYLVPHLWTYLVQRRSVSKAQTRSWNAPLYRAWWFLGIDIGLHLIIKSLVSLPNRASWLRFFYRRLLSKLIVKNVTVIDTSERTLVMEHELFKHLEIEIFVPSRNLGQAAEFIRLILEVFDGTSTAPSKAIASELKSIGMYEELLAKRGTFSHHYPIAFRRVLPDDTLISMSSGNGDTYYAISFITYVEPRDKFFALATFLARSMNRLYQARLHWGKWFPMSSQEVESVYPNLAEFRMICERFDPKGVFRNEFTERAIFNDTLTSQSCTSADFSEVAQLPSRSPRSC